MIQTIETIFCKSSVCIYAFMFHLINSFFIQMKGEKSNTRCQLKRRWISIILKILKIIHSIDFWLCFNLKNYLLLVLYTFSYIIFIVYFHRYSLDIFMMNWIVWTSCDLVIKIIDCAIFVSRIIFMTKYDQLQCHRQCLFYFITWILVG